MNWLFYTTVTMTGFCAIGLVAAAWLSRSSRVVTRRAMTVLNASHAVRPERRTKTVFQQQMLALVSWLRDTLGLSVGAKQIARFEQAGVMKSADRDLFVVSRILAPLLAIVVGSFIPWNRPLFMMSLPGFAYIAPEFVLTRMIKRRRERIRLGVPDAVDLLVICVDAGLGLDQAMLRVAQELGKRHPDLQQEFLRINREQRAGKQRLDAWQSMAERSQLVEVDGFVNMLQQTDRFGTPIARALAEYSDLIRQKRRQRAEELAAKTTVKIIFPLVLCIFPSLFIVLLGPPGIKVSNGLGF
jgi:tight adherence protein C